MDYQTEGKRLKKKAKSKGNFVSVNISNPYSLMKILAHFFYKKHHEWAAICFLDRTYSCNKIWFNKGPNHTTVSLGLTPEEISKKAAKLNVKNIIIAHNHPVSSKDMPNYNSRSANIGAQKQLKNQLFGFSSQDRRSGKYYEANLAAKELNVAEAVFVAGSYQIEGAEKIVDNYSKHRRKEGSIFSFTTGTGNVDDSFKNNEKQFVIWVLVIIIIFFIIPLFT